MIRAKIVFVIALALVPACAGCPVKPGPVELDASPTLVDAHAQSACARACANLRALGCSSGAPNCEDVCTHAQSSGLTDLKPECLADAGSKEAARACGSTTCP